MLELEVILGKHEGEKQGDKPFKPEPQGPDKTQGGDGKHGSGNSDGKGKK
ncbi:hypothetical protein ACFLIM_17395 [Nonomuraea sp. M3C6]|uniref:Uncharacterized protein n=1 Tax=Nonomuraea marmarensis TaxID=3351344 RepID=A0ABW7AC74_9ACTN